MHARVLMSNHVHLLCSPKSENGIREMRQALSRQHLWYLTIRINAQALHGRDALNPIF